MVDLISQMEGLLSGSAALPAPQTELEAVKATSAVDNIKRRMKRLTGG